MSSVTRLSSLMRFKMAKTFSHHMVIKRYLLSSSYGCSDAWNKYRMEDPLLSQFSPEQYFMDVSQRFYKKQKVGAVDVDIFANICSKESNIEELEHLLLNLRKTRRTKDMMESTHAATVRFYLEMGKADRLLAIIHKRIEFGIFPDHFNYNLLLDHFIQKKDMRSAAKVATCYMLQEDYSNTITNRLAIHSVIEYLKDANRQAWDDSVVSTAAGQSDEAAENDDDDDEDDATYIRIPWMRNEDHFDDHFDLKDGLHLCGKTLWFIGRDDPSLNGILSRSLQMIGLVFYEKFELSSRILDQMIQESKGSPVLTKDSVDWIISILSPVVNDSSQSDDAADDSEKKDAPKSEPSEDDEKKRLLMKDLMDQISKVKTDEDSTLEQLVQQKLQEIPSLEAIDIKSQLDQMDDFKKERQLNLRRQMNELIRDEKIKEIKQKRSDLDDREKLLFFFENINRHEMDFQAAQENISKSKSQAKIEEDYIPPTVKQSIKSVVDK